MTQKNRIKAQDFLSTMDVGYSNKTWDMLTEFLDKSDTETCTWMMDDPDYNGWFADCGFEFRFEDGSPLENRMKYCSGCGKLIVEKINPDIDYTNMEWKND